MSNFGIFPPSLFYAVSHNAHKSIDENLTNISLSLTAFIYLLAEPRELPRIAFLISTQFQYRLSCSPVGFTCVGGGRERDYTHASVVCVRERTQTCSSLAHQVSGRPFFYPMSLEPLQNSSRLRYARPKVSNNTDINVT